MATKIGVIAEGEIDEALLPPLLDGIARRVGFTWPVIPGDLGKIIPIRSRGHGGVLEKVRALVNHLKTYPPLDHAFFVILLDKNTQQVQKQIRELIQGEPLFVMGVAIEEIEAWWLADKRNLYAFLGLQEEACINTRFGRKGYAPEKDDAPKKTLDELTLLSPTLPTHYGHCGNLELAREFAEDYWKGRVDLEAIESKCPQGFAPFCKEVTQSLRSEISRQKSGNT